MHRPNPASDRIMDLPESQALIAQLDIPNQVEPILREGPTVNLERFLGAVDRLKAVSVVFSQNSHLNPCEGAYRRSNVLLDSAMKSLLEEFSKILETNNAFVDPVQLRDYLRLTSNGQLNDFHEQLVIPECVPILHEIAMRMVASGFEIKCANAYREKRVTAVERSLERLGMERWSRQAIHTMPWEQLSSKMRSWVEQIRICVRVLLAGELSLCNRVFGSLDLARETCISELANASLVGLINFANAIVDSSRGPEKLPYLLDMYETLEELQNPIEGMFPGPSGRNLRSVMSNLLRSFATSIRDTYNQFETIIIQDISDNQPNAEPRPNLLTGFLRVFTNEPETGGRNKPFVPANAGVLQLTSYIVNFLNFLLNNELNYLNLLRRIYRDQPQADGSFRGGALTTATSRIMAALKSNLEDKASQGYRDPSYQIIFLLNNFLKIFNSFNSSNVREILTEAWMRRYRGYVDAKREEYLQLVNNKFNPIFSELESDPGRLVARLRNLRNALDELKAVHTSVVIVDPDLRRQIRDGVRSSIMENYYNFINNNRKLIMEHSNLQRAYTQCKYEDVDKDLRDSFPSQR